LDDAAEEDEEDVPLTPLLPAPLLSLFFALFLLVL